ncbi:AraC family transcriptional regulator, partial [Enterococcus faecalis]|uniref:helix-turn-helix transcriptional regulator n=1 Tax=Enterococcus faecalis TaxID=1351 RepID=UPI0010C0CE36
NLTPTYLSRLLKEEVGIPFSQFYRQLKITWAKQLLLETDKTLAQISEDLGFVEDSYFVRIFKQETVETHLKYLKIMYRA